MRNLRPLCALILGLTGCAAKPEIVLTNLPLAGEVRGASGSITEASLREAGLSTRGDRIVVARVSVRNQTGEEVSFGPEHVYVVDATGVLFLRIAEEWLHGFYTARVSDRRASVSSKAIAFFPSAEVRVGEAAFRSPRLTAVEQRKMAEEMAALVEEVFVRPRREAPGTFLEKGAEASLGVLLKEATLKPGQGVSGFVYFYHPAAATPQYPLRLLADLEGEVSSFLFQ